MVVSVAEAFSDYADEIVSRCVIKAFASSTTHRRSLWAKNTQCQCGQGANVLVVGEREQTEPLPSGATGVAISTPLTQTD